MHSNQFGSGPESDPRANRIRDYLQTLELDGYKLAIDELAAGNNDLRQEPLREHIVDAIAAQHKDSPSFSIPDYSTAGGWRIKLTAYDGQQFGSNDLPTVFQESWVRNWCGPMYPLRDALKKKAGKYGRFEMPYVITVNSFDVNLTERDFEETLFGLRPGITITGMTKRLASGFWGREESPCNRRVSAVLFTVNLMPETVLTGKVNTCLYLNPWAENPYDGLLTRLTSFQFENGQAREVPGNPFFKLMRLEPFTDISIWD